jgi:diguanylate cyclase (GGDEF)-like protein
VPPEFTLKLQQVDNQLQVNHSQLTASLNQLDCALLLEDGNHKVLFINDPFCQMWQLPSADRLLGLNGHELIKQIKPLIGNSKLFSYRLTKVSCRRTKATNLEVRLIDGRILTCNYMPVLINDDFCGHLWKLSDITDRKNTEETLHQNQQLLELFFSQSLDGCFFMALDQPVLWNDAIDKEATLNYVMHHQRLTRINDALVEQYKTTYDQLIGKTPAELFSGNLDYAKSIWRQFFDAGRLRIDMQQSMAISTELWIEGDYICLYDEYRRIVGHFGIQRDITGRKQAEAHIRYQAHHDPLTNLPNRLLFWDRLNIALSQAEREETMMALLFLDCYQFKQVNDNFGHANGDRMLQLLAKRLLESVRKGDTVARLGGDEFVIILPRIRNYDEAQLVTQRILEAFRCPMPIGDNAVEVGASIGISVYPYDATNAEDLLLSADKAMYQAKSDGSHAYCFYTSSKQKRPHL